MLVPALNIRLGGWRDLPFFLIEFRATLRTVPLALCLTNTVATLWWCEGQLFAGNQEITGLETLHSAEVVFGAADSLADGRRDFVQLLITLVGDWFRRMLLLHSCEPIGRLFEQVGHVSPNARCWDRTSNHRGMNPIEAQPRHLGSSSRDHQATTAINQPAYS